MSGSGYDKAQNLRTYRFPAVAVSAVAVVGRIQGPAGKRGRVVGFEYLLTTGVTTAAANVAVDTNAGLSAPFNADLEVAAINTGGAASAAELKAGDELPADTVIELQSTSAAPGAGAADVALTVQWY